MWMSDEFVLVYMDCETIQMIDKIFNDIFIHTLNPTVN